MKAAVPADSDDPLLIVRSVELGDDDYIRAGLRPRVRKRMPAIRPFDADEAANRICAGFMQAWLARTEYKYDLAMSREEAIMLFHAVTQGGQNWRQSLLDYNPARLLAMPRDLGKPDIPRPIWDSNSSLICCLLFRIYSPAEFTEHTATLLAKNNSHPSTQRLEYIRTALLPYVSDEALAEMQNALSLFMAARQSPGEELLLFASVLRLFEPIKAWLENPPPKRWHEYVTQHLVLSLGDAEAIERHYRRLGYYLTSPAHARQWLAATQAQGLNLVAASAEKQFNSAAVESIIRVAARVQAPETALHMLAWQMKKKAQSICKEWFEANPTHAAAGLAPIIAGKDEKSAVAAAAILRSLVKRGHERVVRAHLETLPEDIFERVSGPILEIVSTEAKYEPIDDANTPETMRVDPGPNTQSKPGDPLIGDLPALAFATDDGLRRLNDDQIYTLLHALQKSKLGAPQPFVTAVKSMATPQSRDAFAWALLENWLAEGAILKEKWKMLSVGLLGGEQCVLKLMPLIRQWPGEGLHSRAVSGIQCLEAIGTDTALMQINGLTQKAAYRAIKIAAYKCMNGIAEKRGLTRPELEDRIVPDCGLDEHGARLFDFGPRQFTMSLSPEMKPVLHEIKDGQTLPKSLTDLPKPNRKDDPDLSEAAVADWKILKKQVFDTAKIQAVRLEHAMVTGRRWKPEEFEQLMVRRPLMGNIARLLVWGVYDEHGKLTGSFRVTEDLSYATPQDDIYNLPDGARLGVAHPLHLSKPDRGAWAEIWSDYELVPPFAQLDRPAHALEPNEAEGIEIKRFASDAIPAPTLVFALEKRGWMRSTSDIDGNVGEHTKTFYGADVTAVAQYDPGYYIGDTAGSDDQRVSDVFFIPQVYRPNGWPRSQERIPLSQVDPIVISEVLGDLISVIEKARQA